MRRIVVSPSARVRLAAAADFVRSFSAGTELLVVATTREAADDFARDLGGERGATFGLHRFSLAQLAARTAALDLGRLALAASTALGTEALAARCASSLAAADRLGYFTPVHAFPGFARALAATLEELRLAAVSPEHLAGVDGPAADLAEVLRAYERGLTEAGIADRADLFAAATRHWTQKPMAMPILFLDVALASPLERRFAAAVLAGPDVLVTRPSGDHGARDLVPAAVVEEIAPNDDGSLARLQAFLFGGDSPPVGERDRQVRFFSAPGEARECVEMARLILEEARSGVNFDRIAVFLRVPGSYTTLLQAAFRRAGIPAYFARGTNRPDPAGRAFLSLLACREEGLAATRFAEYLSLAQVPLAPAAGEGAPAEGEGRPAPTPWRWESFLMEAAVIGGRDRWERRLRGLEEDRQARRAELLTEEPDSTRCAALARDVENIRHLREFAVPLVDTLAELPRSARWGEWLAPLRTLAERALRHPERVLAVLEELAPMADVGPVGVAEIALVLGERLSTLEEDPPDVRYGRVFVAPVAHARGRSFEVVFVPGLAERAFPQRPREDPLLLDARRLRLDAGLRTQIERGAEERLLLRLGVGAAASRLYISYPRVDVIEARSRVTSFYGLDVARAMHGEIPDVEALARQAEEEVQARLAWPAPPQAMSAIDAVEHDLAVLAEFVHGTDLSQAKGRARYLLDLNPWLRQSLRSRYARWQRRDWRKQDGLVHPEPAVQAALASYGLRARPYSASALQRFAACPYQFLLASIHRLEPREEPAPLERLDPLTRGRIFHAIQSEALHGLAQGGLLPLTPEHVVAAEEILARRVERIAAAQKELLAPPIERVWQDEIDTLHADLRIWLRRMADEGTVWTPRYFELAFGLPQQADRDPASVPDPVVLPGGWLLRGSVDLVEENRDDGTLRVTDHKTGRDSTPPGLIVGGGEVLQPVLYSLAVEAAMSRTVSASRLYYCTTRGAFGERHVPLTRAARDVTGNVLETINRAIETGTLLPAPRKDACKYCDFRVVCGPYEEIRSTRFKEPIAPLRELRGLQ